MNINERRRGGDAHEHREGEALARRRSVRLGPTLQGEGHLAGVSTYFVRFGGCDYKCSWCDSLYAVTPELWKDSPRLSAGEIVKEIGRLHEGPEWVTLTGGNPVLHQLGPLIDALHADGLKVTVETQGSIWHPWLAMVDHLTLSPKPPSSGMVTETHDKQWVRFLDRCVRQLGYTPATSCKIVVFDDADYEWAVETFRSARAKQWPLYLSVGTDQDKWMLPTEVTESILGRFHWLCDKVKDDPRLHDVHVLPQLHVLAWGIGRGV